MIAIAGHNEHLLEPTEDELWEHARKAYEDGLSVAEICGRYGLARATVYQRAQMWRAARGEVDLDAPRPKAAVLADIAWRRLARAVEAGRIQEALCWRALTDTLEKRAAQEAWTEKIKGKSLREASDVLLARCDEIIADEKAMKAASLDTPLPASETASSEEDEAEVPTYTEAEVREWRAWAAYSERFPVGEGGKGAGSPPAGGGVMILGDPVFAGGAGP